MRPTTRIVLCMMALVMAVSAIALAADHSDSDTGLGLTNFPESTFDAHFPAHNFPESTFDAVPDSTFNPVAAWVAGDSGGYQDGCGETGQCVIER